MLVRAEPRTIDIAEAAGLALLRVMKSTGPVDSDVTFLAVQAGRALHGATGANSTELEETIKDRAVISDIVLGLLALVLVHVVGRDFAQEVNVLVGVELCHLVDNGRFRALSSIFGISNCDLQRAGDLSAGASGGPHSEGSRARLT